MSEKKKREGEAWRGDRVSKSARSLLLRHADTVDSSSRLNWDNACLILASCFSKARPTTSAVQGVHASLSRFYAGFCSRIGLLFELARPLTIPG